MEKQRWEESERRRKEVRRSERRKSEKKEDAGARKSRKVTIHCVFQWLWLQRGRSHLARWEMKSCAPLWREAHFEIKMYKAFQLRRNFWSCDVEKVHAVVARSTFPSESVQNTQGSDHFWQLRCRKSARSCGGKRVCKSKCTNTPTSNHFWKLRCRKSARSCGAKHISKSKWTKHTRFGQLLEVEISKKCTPLWREASFQVKTVKKVTGSDHFFTFRCRKRVYADVARSTFPSQSVKNWGNWAFFDVQMSKSAH